MLTYGTCKYYENIKYYIFISGHDLFDTHMASICTASNFPAQFVKFDQLQIEGYN